MANINAVIVPAKALKDGKHKIRISVAHNGETRYIVTDITIDSAKEFKNGTIVKRPDAAILNTKIRGLMQKCQSTIDEIDYVNGLSCAELVYQIKNSENRKHRTLSSIYEEYIENARIKPGTLKCYDICWKAISGYLNKGLLIENITYATILCFDKHLWKRGLKPTTIRNYLVFLNILMNYAKKCGYVNFKVDPFLNHQLPNNEIRQSWLSVDEVKSIRDLQIKKRSLAFCRDLFMLSYYLGGINLVDLLDIDFNEQTTTIHYVRRKTENRPKLNKFVEFDIPEEAIAIIDRYKGKDGHIIASKTQRLTRFNHFLSYNMPKLASALGIKKLIYYSARKSFSQHAFNLGVNTSVIDYILGHSVDKSNSSLYSYIYVTPEMATKAIRLVLDNLK